jgi:hypothetical protein
VKLLDFRQLKLAYFEVQSKETGAVYKFFLALGLPANQVTNLDS